MSRISLNLVKKPVPPKLNLGTLSLKKTPSPEPEVAVYSDSSERTKIRARFVDLLGESLGTDCELAMYLYERDISKKDFPDLEFSKNYRKHALNLIRNLNPTGSVKNQYLKPLVVSGQLSCEQLAALKPQDLLPEKWEGFREERRQEIQAENILQQSAKGSDLFRCPRCKERDTDYHTEQRRGSDEPMTAFIKCNKCGNEWTAEA